MGKESLQIILLYVISVSYASRRPSAHSSKDKEREMMLLLYERYGYGESTLLDYLHGSLKTRSCTC